jgi:ribosomal protein L27
MAIKSYSADEARGGEIILRQRWEKIIFLGGLAGTVLLLVIANFIWA